MAQTDNLWSVLRYDLQTALDVVGIPCCLKLADATLGDVSRSVLERSGIGVGSVMKIEKELRFPCVRVRIREPADLDWFIFTKGEEFVAEHSEYLGAELYLPLGYKGKLRLCDRTGGKEYHNIREVVADFPRFVRVEQDAVCANPGRRSYQVVHAGTELEIDRVTEGNKSLRGMRDNFLVCTDKTNFRELNFPVFSPVHFTKLGDNTKYTLAELVERLPLPQTVEFLGVNPYDVVTTDDDEAKELLLMLSGPIEILEVVMVPMYVGLVQSELPDCCDIIAIPSKCDAAVQSMVYIPITYVVDGADNPYFNYDLGRLNIDIVREGLYLQPVDSPGLLLLKNQQNPERNSYGQEALPDTPRLPRKQENRMTVLSTNSAPTANELDEPDLNFAKKRFRSTGDLKHRRSASVNIPEREPRGIRVYLSQLTRRVKSSASQLLFGIDVHSSRPRWSGGDLEQANKRSLKHRPSLEKSASFICYLSEEFGRARQTVEPEITREGEKTPRNEGKETNCLDTPVVCPTSQIKNGEEVIYASIDRPSQNVKVEDLDNSVPCVVCLEIQKMQNG